MLFHRTKEPVTVQSREEEDALGREWSRIIWPVSAIAAPDDAPPSPEPELFTADYTEAEPEEEPAPAAKPTQPVRAHNKPHARSKKKG
jgi:hypothetical protein